MDCFKVGQHYIGIVMSYELATKRSSCDVIVKNIHEVYKFPPLDGSNDQQRKYFQDLLCFMSSITWPTSMNESFWTKPSSSSYSSSESSSQAESVMVGNSEEELD